jgi:hypothetical protein
MQQAYCRGVKWFLCSPLVFIVQRKCASNGFSVVWVKTSAFVLARISEMRAKSAAFYISCAAKT